MSFFFIGILMLAFALFMLRRARKNQDREGIVGMTSIAIAAIILIVFFGIFYNTLIG